MQYVKKLMEEIPNKVRDMMGILVDVNLKEKDWKSYPEIVTEAYPICFRGKYYQSKSACMLLCPAFTKCLRQSEIREGDGTNKKAVKCVA